MIGNDNDIILNEFEKTYIRLREKEERIYTDEEVACLPDIAESHPHFKEWKIRKDSSQKLLSYLERKNNPINILEIGCGNGWLSGKLATLHGSQVIGIDINFTEIQQAARVFQESTNLHFIYGNDAASLFEKMKFDVIVFAASVQYFASLAGTIRNVLPLLKPTGEIHIIDTHFYSLPGLRAARERSLLYFETAGFPEMANWYFHHTLEDLDLFNYSVLYDPESLFNRFLKNKNPFHWILINANGR